LPGVAKIDVSKRTNVSSAIERAIDELLKRQAQLARAALSVPAEKSEFGYGRVVGQFQAYEDARSVLEHCLNESDPARERHDER
jgi:hypothetical protein